VFKKIDVLQSYRSLQALQFSYKLYLHSILYVKLWFYNYIMQKKKKNGYPYPTRISGYLSGSSRSVSDPNMKLQYPDITRIRPEYKITRIRIWVFALSISGTRRVYLTRFHPYSWVFSAKSLPFICTLAMSVSYV
jgi:hypothetical protein